MCARHFGLSLCVNRIFNVEHNNMWGHSTNFSRIYHPSKFNQWIEQHSIYSISFLTKATMKNNNNKNNNIKNKNEIVDVCWFCYLFFSSKPLKYSYSHLNCIVWQFNGWFLVAHNFSLSALIVATATATAAAATIAVAYVVALFLNFQCKYWVVYFIV